MLFKDKFFLTFFLKYQKGNMFKRNKFFSAQYALMHHAIFPFDASTKSKTIKFFHRENVIMMLFKSRFELDYKKPRRSYTTYAL